MLLTSADNRKNHRSDSRLGLEISCLKLNPKALLRSIAFAERHNSWLIEFQFQVQGSLSLSSLGKEFLPWGCCSLAETGYCPRQTVAPALPISGKLMIPALGACPVAFPVILHLHEAFQIFSNLSFQAACAPKSDTK